MWSGLAVNGIPHASRICTSVCVSQDFWSFFSHSFFCLALPPPLCLCKQTAKSFAKFSILIRHRNFVDLNSFSVPFLSTTRNNRCAKNHFYHFLFLYLWFGCFARRFLTMLYSYGLVSSTVVTSSSKCACFILVHRYTHSSFARIHSAIAMYGIVSYVFYTAGLQISESPLWEFMGLIILTLFLLFIDKLYVD